LRDDDHDGIPLRDDNCPVEAEDKDGFEDSDGCPEADNDGDGVLDAFDRCPLEAEDMDGMEDKDGCPDVDTDGDGISDHLDKCPTEAEDRDVFHDDDGCDDPDNDLDGIPDVIDQCPLEKETINGKLDDDGCPDPGESLVMLAPDRIEVLEPVAFASNSAKIQKRSFNVLGQVAATLRAQRELKRVRITVYVQPRNSRDRELSEKRAEAVRAWLLQWGVEPERIEARGLGSTKTLVPATQRGAEQINDRVEFILLEKN
jgi:outer membrane protein OmpA-like peptidoglycan-associated protein